LPGAALKDCPLRRAGSQGLPVPKWVIVGPHGASPAPEAHPGHRLAGASERRGDKGTFNSSAGGNAPRIRLARNHCVLKGHNPWTSIARAGLHTRIPPLQGGMIHADPITRGVALGWRMLAPLGQAHGTPGREHLSDPRQAGRERLCRGPCWKRVACSVPQAGPQTPRSAVRPTFQALGRLSKTQRGFEHAHHRVTEGSRRSLRTLKSEAQKGKCARWGTVGGCLAPREAVVAFTCSR